MNIVIDQAEANTKDSAAVAAAPAKADLRGLAAVLTPLALDVAVPLGSYYLLHDGFGVSLVASLALSSVVPGVRTVLGLVRDRNLNALATLMLVVNILGIVLSFSTGDPRLMIAKDSVISSVIAIAILVSVAARRPMMSAGLKPMITKGDPAKVRAWDRLTVESAAFRRAEALFSAIWGGALLADCAVRFVGAFTLPVATMVWLSTVILLGAIGVASMVGSVASRPIEKMVKAEAAAA